MAKLADLISCAAEVTGVPLPTVREIGRRLREAKLIRTGHVGRHGGADMTADDAASLLTGLLIASSSPISFREIGPATRSHLAFKCYDPASRSSRYRLGSWPPELTLPLLCSLKNGHTFKEAFIGLIRSVANGDLEAAIKHWVSRKVGGTFDIVVTVYGLRPHPEARIEFDSPAFKTLELNYLQPLQAQKLYVPESPQRWADVSGGPLDVSATIRQGTLKEIGLLLQNLEQASGKPHAGGT